jgi:DNA-binding NarL/FixJ family response regulator
MHGQESWSSFLAEVRRLAPNGRAFLLYRDHATGAECITLSAGMERAAAEAYRAYYGGINPVRPAVATRPVGRVLSFDQMIAPADLWRSEFYQDFLKPLDVTTGFGVTLRREGAGTFDFTIIMDTLDEAASERVRRTMEALVAPLQQAFGHIRAHHAARRPGAAPPPGAGGMMRIGPGSMVLSADDTAMALLEGVTNVTVDRAGRLATRQQDLSAAIAQALAGSIASLPVSCAVHLRRGEGEVALRLTVMAAAGDEAAFFRGPECIVLVEDPGDALGGAVAEFAGMHGLTPSERGVLFDLVNGHAASDIAAARNIAVGTVRDHIKSIHLRTGLKRQIDLVRHVCLLSGGPCAPDVALPPHASAGAQALRAPPSQA